MLLTWEGFLTMNFFQRIQEKPNCSLDITSVILAASRIVHSSARHGDFPYFISKLFGAAHPSPIYAVIFECLSLYFYDGIWIVRRNDRYYHPSLNTVLLNFGNVKWLGYNITRFSRSVKVRQDKYRFFFKINGYYQPRQLARIQGLITMIGNFLIG